MNDEDLIDKYMNGFCMYLAAAIRHKTGWPIGLMTVFHKERECLSHAWIKTPTNECLDVQGLQTLEQVTIWSQDAPEIRYTIYESTTLSHLERLVGHALDLDDPDVTEAMFVCELLMTLVETQLT